MYTPFAQSIGNSSGIAFSDRQKENATEIYNYLRNKNVSINAICAMLGNWQSESTLNPNRPQTNIQITFPNTKTGGFGLPQWTPWGDKIGWYAEQQGVSINRTDTSGIGQFPFQWAYHDYECINGLKGDRTKKTWVNRKGYNISWTQFKTSDMEIEWLAAAYYWNYEYSAALSPGTRPQQARAWYDFLRGVQPTPPKPKESKSSFVLIAYSSGVI